MKNNLLKQFFKLTATALACAAISISIPSTTPPLAPVIPAAT